MSVDIGTLLGHINFEDNASAALVTFQKNLKNVSSDFTRAGTSLSVGITAPLVAAAGASLLFSSNFEIAMTRLVSLAGVSQEELAGVKQHILDLAPAVGVGPQALAEAMTKVSSTVSDTKVALNILDQSAKGSAAGLGTAVDVAGALTAVINSYGAGNITAAHAADVLTKAVQDGGAEAKELAPTLANVVPIAAQLGVSFEEVAANIATVTKLGVPATEAVTQLSSVFSALLKETHQGKEALASVGMTFAQVREEVKEKGLADTLIHLTEVFGDNKTALTDVFGRIEALRNVMSSAGQQAGTYRLEVERMTRASDGLGAATLAFNAVQGTQAQTWAQVSAAVQAAAIKFGDALAPAMKSVLDHALPLVDVVGKLASWFAQLPSGIQTTAIVVAGLAAAAGPLLLAIGGIGSGVASLSLALPALGIAMTALATGPAGLIAGAIAAIGVAIIAVRQQMNGLKDDKPGEQWKGMADSAKTTAITLEEAAAKLREMRAAGAASSIPRDASGAPTSFPTPWAPKPGDSGTAGTIKVISAEQLELDKKSAKAKEDIRRAMIPLTAEQIKQIDVWDKFNITASVMSDRLKVSETVVEKHLTTIHKAATAQEHFLASVKQTVVGVDLAVPLFKGLAGSGKEIQEVAENLSSRTLIDFRLRLQDVGTHASITQKAFNALRQHAFDDLGALAQGFSQLAQVSGDSFGGVVQDVARVVNALDIAEKSVVAYEKANTAMGKAAAIASGLAAVGAATGSGSAGSRIAGGAARGATVGSAFGPAGAVIGAVGGAVVGLVRSFKNLEKEMNPIRQGFIDSFRTVDINGVHDGLAVLNQKAHEAGMTLDHLLNAKNEKEYKAAVDELTVAFAQQEQKVKDWEAAHEKAIKNVEDRMKDLLGTVDKVGVGLPNALRPAVEELLKMPGLTEDMRKSLEGLQGTGPDLNELEKRAKAVGIELGNMGTVFQQNHVNVEAQGLISLFDELKDAGADTNGVLAGMADEVSNVVQESFKFKTTVPENMRPMIEALIRSGKLLDEHGNKIDDIDSIHFGDPVKTDVEKVADAIKDLADAIAGIPAALATIPTSLPNPFAQWRVPDGATGPGRDTSTPDYRDAMTASTGGMVPNYYGQGGNVVKFKAKGSDTVPAMLTPGEGVIRVEAMSKIGPEGLDALNRGAGLRGGGGTVVINIDRRQIAELIVPEIPGVIERYGIGA